MVIDINEMYRMMMMMIIMMIKMMKFQDGLSHLLYNIYHSSANLNIVIQGFFLGSGDRMRS